jgi:hypothetical protein
MSASRYVSFRTMVWYGKSEYALFHVITFRSAVVYILTRIGNRDGSFW